MIDKFVLPLVLILVCNTAFAGDISQNQYHKVPAVEVEKFPSYWYQQPSIYPYFSPPLNFPTVPIIPDYIPTPNPTPYYFIPTPIYPKTFVDVPVVVERGVFCKKYYWTYKRYYLY